jgi:hypothetical protein
LKQVFTEKMGEKKDMADRLDKAYKQINVLNSYTFKYKEKTNQTSKQSQLQLARIREL